MFWEEKVTAKWFDKYVRIIKKESLSLSFHSVFSPIHSPEFQCIESLYMPKLSNRYLTLSLFDKIFPYNFVRKFFLSLAFERFYRIGDISIHFWSWWKIPKKNLKKLRWDFDGLISNWKLALLCVVLKKNDHAILDCMEKIMSSQWKNNAENIAQSMQRLAKSEGLFEIISQISGSLGCEACILEYFHNFQFSKLLFLDWNWNRRIKRSILNDFGIGFGFFHPFSLPLSS